MNRRSKATTAATSSGAVAGGDTQLLPRMKKSLKDPEMGKGDDGDDEVYNPKISTVQKRRRKANRNKRRRKATNLSNMCVIAIVFGAILGVVVLGILVVKVFWIGYSWASGGGDSTTTSTKRTNQAMTRLFSLDDRRPAIQYPKYPKRRYTQNIPKDIQLSQEAIDMCTQTLWHTIETTTIVMPDGDTFVHTGDIDDLWLRDSAAQIHTLLVPLGGADLDKPTSLISSDPQLDRIVAGLIQRTAMYIRHDPYANAFRIDDSYKFSEEQKKLGRRDLISTWNYELDSACYYIRMLWMYWKQSPNGDLDSSVLKLPRVVEAVEIMIDLWKAEQRHENDNYPTGPLFDCQNCNKPYRYPSLKRQGKGSKTNSTSGLTWTGFRPSDDECQYHFLVPANMFAVVALEYVVELSQQVWNSPTLATKALSLAQGIQKGIEDHAIVNHPKYGRIYAYEVDGLGNYNLMDDANVPSLLSIPYLGYNYYNPQMYENTRKFLFSSDNPTYQKGTNPTTGEIEGYGSPHMKARIYKNIWPMSIAMQGLVEDDPYVRAGLVELLVKASAGTHWMHESINVNKPQDFTRSWFCWADSLFAELVLTLTDECPNPNHKYRVMEWRDPIIVPGGPYAES